VLLSTRLYLGNGVSLCESKKVAPPPKTFCNIFTRVKYISVKFCQYVASLYLHMLTNFGRFVLIFNKMALIFLGVPIVFNVSSFKFYKVKSPTLSPILNGLQSHPTSIHWIIRLREMLESYYKLQPKQKNSSQVCRCTLADLVCVAGESH